MPDTSFRKRILTFWMFLVVLIGVLGTPLKLAHAHAEYERSKPPAGAVIPLPPSEVHAWFTQELFRREGANALEVFGPDGSQVDQGDARIDDDDRSHMLVSLQTDLPAGTYTVRWRTLSAEDGDTDSGEFSFTVDPTAPQATPEPGPTPMSIPTSTPTPTPVPTPTPSSGPGGFSCLGSIFGFLATATILLPGRKRGAA
jgi:methionine-rich copper-binding protein CopC